MFRNSRIESNHVKDLNFSGNVIKNGDAQDCERRNCGQTNQENARGRKFQRDRAPVFVAVRTITDFGEKKRSLRKSDEKMFSRTM